MSNVSNEQMLDGDAGSSGYVAPVDPVVAPVPVVDDETDNQDKEETGRSYRGTGKNRIRITTFTDGSFTEEADPEDDPVAPVAPVDPVFGGTRKDARKTIEAVLNIYGLGGLSKKLYDLYASGEVNIENPDALIFAIRNEPEYKTRFAANELRKNRAMAKGGPLSELDPGSYIELENTFRRLMQSNGLPSGFYDQTSDFTALLEGDVSPSELQDRIQNGFRAVQDADPEVKRQMLELYGVNEAGLAAYFLDPERAAPILTRRAEAAKIAARAKEQGRIQLLSGTAEEIAARGITAQEAEAGFTNLGLQQGLYTEMAGEQALTQQEKVGAALGYDVQGKTKLAQRVSTRKSAFQGGGSFTKTTGQTSGTTESGLNVAQ